MSLRRLNIFGLCFVILAVALAVSVRASAAEPRVKLTFAQCCPPDHTYGVYAHMFADNVAKESKGEIKVETLDGGVMGTEQAIAQKVQLGVVQMGGITSNNVAQLAPALNVLVMPYLASSPDELTGKRGLLRSGPYRDELNKRVLKESGTIRLIGGFTNSFRSMFTKKKCISTIDDLKGLKIRAPKNPVMTAMWESWGVSTYPIAWGETFGAIGSGVVDAFDSPTDVILKMGFYQHIKYITEATYLPQAAVVIINNDFFKGLSEKDQATLLRAAEATDVQHAKYVDEQVEKTRQALVSQHGVTFCKLKDAAVWQERARGAWPKLYELVGGGKEWVDATLRYKDTGKLQ